jgi:uncharacterized protein (TIGR01568 family)
VNRDRDTSGRAIREMNPTAAAKKRLGVGGFALGCGCKDAKAVAVAASSASPYSTEASTATSSSTWRRVRAAAAHPSASGSTGTLTVPSASSSSFFPWDNEEGVDWKREREGSAANTPSFSGLLRQLNDVEQSVVSSGRKCTSTSKQRHLSPPLPPLPSRSVVVKQRALHSGDSKEGQGNFSPPPPPPPPSFQFQTQQQHRKSKSMDKGERQKLAALLRQPPPLSPPEPEKKPPNMKSMLDKGSKQKEEPPSMRSMDKAPLQQQQPQAPNHRKAKSYDGTVAVVKQSDDPLGDFRRSMVNMIVENRIATVDELRDLLRHFLALNAPHHHDAILRAFTEIWDEAFPTKAQHRESSASRRPSARHAARAWR